MQKIILKPGKAKPFRHHEPLVFSGAINRVEGLPQAGDLVQVLDDQLKLIGFGMFNPHSMYRVRLLAFADEELKPDLATILHFRLQQAMRLRESWQLPNQQTNAYRLLNSEGDRVSGLIIDVFSNHLVIGATAYWVLEHREILEKTLELHYPNYSLHWLPNKKSLIQDGWPHTVDQADSDIVTIREHGLEYSVDVGQGQKTGFYCDQRDNRFFIRQFVAGKRVLDCYCYTGGFALNAAKAGAKQVIGVDSSAHAIELAKENAKQNNCNQIEFIQQKAEHYLQDAGTFDVIILDPPKLAPSKKHINRARQYYLKLNTLALAALPMNGKLLTCSCSDAMDQTLFTQTIQLAAKKADRKIEIIKVLGAAPDHRHLSKAQYGAYLKAIWLEVVG